MGVDDLRKSFRETAPGGSTLILNLLRQDNSQHMASRQLSKQLRGNTPPWLLEYRQGFDKEVYGLQLRRDFVDLNFIQAAKEDAVQAQH